MPGGIGTTELLIIALIILFLFGGRKIPELIRGLADGIKEFRKGTAKKEESTETEEE